MRYQPQFKHKTARGNLPATRVDPFEAAKDQVQAFKTKPEQVAVSEKSCHIGMG